MDEVNLLDGRLKVRHLVLALAVVEHGGFAKAARSLHVTQPVVTRGIKELEEILGLELFERGPKGIVTNEFAEVFLEHARAIVGHLRQMGRQAGEASSGMVGTVTVASHLAGSNVLLPTAIILLKKDYPKINVIVRNGTPERLAAELASGQIDLMVGRQGQLQTEIRVEQVELYEEPFRIVARPGHPVFGGPEPGLPELLEYPWILPVAETSLRSELTELFRRSAGRVPAEQIECGLQTTVRAIVRATDHLAVMPETIAQVDPELAVVPTVLQGVSQKVVATIPADFPLSLNAKAMLQCLRRATLEVSQG
ncbi:LysR substrate-binding domain-containing protein [Sinomonas terrae]|uniref:LysR substrate-binding domain-containing protein n=1 Tax=Sinomonas terrae TaxID=2908838 RepID=A0ABS9U4H8_9MICC|nr:LysR substrate-binding domain-containing protein [Sinomonas terrae]MCH6471588.1 LysR substrate-binding domain-containing protein [Sinomonas terrae]